MSTYYVGLSVTGHDPALAIVDEGGTLVFAEATERFIQDKRGWGAAADHLAHLTSAVAQSCRDVTRIVVATTWLRAKFDSALASEASHSGLLGPDDLRWLGAHQARAFNSAGMNIRALFPGTPVDLRHYDHHLAHAAFAISSAPFDYGKCLVIDGEGEVGAVSLYQVAGRRPSRQWRSFGPGSLGAFYSLLTRLCGFDWKAGEEWKVMGLAAFGTPRPSMIDALSRLITIEKGRPRILSAATLTDVIAELGGFARAQGGDLMEAADLAASGQAVYAALTDRILHDAGLQPQDNLILTGGCALNSSYNGTIRRRFDLGAVHVPSAPGDDGNAAGAALLAWAEDHDAALPRTGHDPFLGTAPCARAIERVAHAGGWQHVGDARDPACVADLLVDGKIIGVMRGRAEYGPRSLGNRSILADPSIPGMKDRINRRVKGREPYRPFAPVVLAAEAGDWFDDVQPSPYMSFTKAYRPGKAAQVAAAVHEDGTGRLQTITAEANPWLASLVGAMKAAGGASVLLNTSLNVMGKPIAHSVSDAVAILGTTGLDALVLDDLVIAKRVD